MGKVSRLQKIVLQLSNENFLETDSFFSSNERSKKKYSLEVMDA